MKLLHIKYLLIVSALAIFGSSCSNTVQTPEAAIPEASPTAVATLPPPTLAVVSLPTETPDKPQVPPDLEYPILLEHSKQSDPNFDFTKLRWTYAQTANYDPYNNGTSDLENEMYDAYDKGDNQLAIDLANQILEKNYLLPDPHFVLLQAYGNLGDQKNADFHSYFLKGLITSISKSGNGTSPETAFIVIQFEEEYFMLNILGIQNSNQTFQEIDGIPYDIFEGVDQDTNQTATIYFNVSIPSHVLNNGAPSGPAVP